jgi:Protein of unknown function (DUF4239)
MLTTWEDFAIVIASVAVALAFLWVLQRLWPGTQRLAHNDVIGWQVSVLGTTYAVLIGFMLYAVWTSFETAEINADQEANSLVNVFRLADGLPKQQHDEVQRLASQYADTVISQEWPAMNRGDLSLAAHPIVDELWAAVAQTKPANFAEQTSMNLTLNEISNMTQYRRVRQVESEAKLPSILWVLLIFGGCVTTVSACLFGTSNFRLHLVMVLFLSLLISVTLVAIADIDQPFRGSVHVEPLSFGRARDTFASLSQR